MKTDTANNVVYVSADKNCPALWTREIVLEDCKWVSGAAPAADGYLIRSRHTRKLEEARIEADLRDASKARVCFDEPVHTVAPGQAVSVYDGLECLGGGIVSNNL